MKKFIVCYSLAMGIFGEVLLFQSIAFAETKAMKDGKEIILKDDGTWEYVDTNLTGNANTTDNRVAEAWKKIESGDVPGLKDLLEKGLDVNSRMEEKGDAPLLMRACTKNSFDIVKLLIDKGADVNAKINDGWSVLMAASSVADANIVKLLIEKGADVNARDSRGITALWVAAEGKDKDIDKIKLFIEKKTDVNVKDQNGVTALMRASRMGDAAIIKILLENGANVNAKDRDENTALFYVIRGRCLGDNENADAAKMMADNGIDINAKNMDSTTALMEASEQGFVNIVKILLEKNADMNIKNNFGTTALSFAVMEDRADVVRVLLDNGADPNEKVFDGKILLTWVRQYNKFSSNALKNDRKYFAEANERSIHDGTLLMLSSIFCSSAVADVLIEKGADINAKTKEGDTALKFAIKRQSLTIAQALLKRKANPNDKLDGIPFLLLASQEGYAKMVKLLLENGADVNIRDDFNNTALMIACKERAEEVIDILLTVKDIDVNVKNKAGDDALLLAITFSYDSKVPASLIAKGADINTKDQYGRTALMLSSQKDMVDIMQTILDRGTDIHAKNNFGGGMALHFAAGEGNSAAVKLLLDRGADINAQNNAGDTALMSAVSNQNKITSTSFGMTKVAEVLIERGADVNCRNNKGESALDLAEKYNRHLVSVFEEKISK